MDDVGPVSLRGPVFLAASLVVSPDETLAQGQKQLSPAWSPAAHQLLSCVRVETACCSNVNALKPYLPADVFGRDLKPFSTGICGTKL